MVHKSYADGLGIALCCYQTGVIDAGVDDKPDGRGE